MPILKRGRADLCCEVTGKGRPLVFLGETACAGEAWKTCPAPESSRDHRCITLDYRSAGRSGKPSVPCTLRLPFATASAG